MNPRLDDDSGLIALICLVLIICVLFGPQVVEVFK